MRELGISEVLLTSVMVKDTNEALRIKRYIGNVFQISLA